MQGAADGTSQALINSFVTDEVSGGRGICWNAVRVAYRNATAAETRHVDAMWNIPPPRSHRSADFADGVVWMRQARAAEADAHAAQAPGDFIGELDRRICRSGCLRGDGS